MPNPKHTEWTQEYAIRVQRSVLAAFTKPHPHKVGDLVQSRRHYVSWAGHDPAPAAPLMVVAVYDDLGAITGTPIDKGVPGIMFSALTSHNEGVGLFQDQAWHFEPYDGPMPDAH